MIQENPKSILFPIALFNEILDTIVVARGVEALANGEGRERVLAYLLTKKKIYNDITGYFYDLITHN